MHLIGHQIIRLEEIDSTNSYAQKLLTSNKHIEGLIVLADHQTSGKGQGNNKWESEKKSNLLMSVILKPQFLMPSQQFYLNMAISLAVVETVREITGTEAYIKWPNDILINRKKIAGILITNTIDSKHINSSIVGIGLNVNQTKFEVHDTTPSSMIIESGHKIELETVFGCLLSNLRNCYYLLSKMELVEIKKLYLERLLFYKQEIVLKHSDHGLIKGFLTGITEFGELQIINEYGLMNLNHDKVKIII